MPPTTPKNRLIPLIITIAILIVGVALLNKEEKEIKRDTVSPTTKSSDYPADFKDATYMIEDKPVTLTNGKAEENDGTGASAEIDTEYFGNEAEDDLTGDGKEDVAFLIAQYGGGTGVFYYLAVALKTDDDGYRGTNALIIGDRIKPQTTEIRDGHILVNFLDRKPSEPMIAEPTVAVKKYFEVVDNKLVELEQM